MRLWVCGTCVCVCFPNYLFSNKIKHPSKLDIFPIGECLNSRAAGNMKNSPCHRQTNKLFRWWWFVLFCFSLGKTLQWNYYSDVARNPVEGSPALFSLQLGQIVTKSQNYLDMKEVWSCFERWLWHAILVIREKVSGSGPSFMDTVASAKVGVVQWDSLGNLWLKRLLKAADLGHISWGEILYHSSFPFSKQLVTGGGQSSPEPWPLSISLCSASSFRKAVLVQ